MCWICELHTSSLVLKRSMPGLDLSFAWVSFMLLSHPSSSCNLEVRLFQPFKMKGDLRWGWIFVLLGSVSFLGFFYAAILSKLLPQSGNQIVSAIQNDRYYCLLVPLTLPVLVVAVYFHWLSMKLFKHA